MTLKELFEKVNIQGTAVIMLTDEFIFAEYPLSRQIEEDKLLDIRIFNKDKEYRLFRDHIGSDFQYRVIDDTQKSDEYNDYFEEIQRLDLDTSKGKDEMGFVYAQGGGKYYLPIDMPDKEKDIKIKIYNYLGYDENNGMAYVKDFRLVELFETARITKLGE